MDVQTTDCQNLTESTKTMADLRGEIILLKDTVKTLKNELDFVLSFLGITSSIRKVTNAEEPGHQSSDAVVMPSQTDGTLSTAITSLSSVATSKFSNCPDISVNYDRTQMTHSYANIVNKPAALSVPFHNAVVSAVHADFEDKKLCYGRGITRQLVSRNSVTTKHPI